MEFGISGTLITAILALLLSIAGLGYSVFKDFIAPSRKRKLRSKVSEAMTVLKREGHQIVARTVKSRADYQTWDRDIEDWFTRSKKYLNQHVTPAEASDFEEIITPPTLPENPFSKEHAHKFQFMFWRVQKLQEMAVRWAVN